MNNRIIKAKPVLVGKWYCPWKTTHKGFLQQHVFTYRVISHFTHQTSIACFGSLLPSSGGFVSASYRNFAQQSQAKKRKDHGCTNTVPRQYIYGCTHTHTRLCPAVYPLGLLIRANFISTPKPSCLSALLLP